jgi:predicted PurR-regulated permease PerM
MKKQFPLILFLLVTILTFFVIKPFITAILFASLFAYIFTPLNNFFKRKIKKDNIATSITTILIILLVLGPLVFIGNSLVEQSYSSYIFAKQKIASLESCKEENIFCDSWNYVEDNLLKKDSFENTIRNISTKAVGSFYNIVKGVADSIINVFMFVVLLFFLLRDGKKVVDKISHLLPFKKKDRKETIREVNNMLHAVIFGAVMVALMQSFLAFIGFLLFGVSNALLWAVIVLFASFVPFIGTFLGWGPVVAIYILTAVVDSDNTGIIKGIFLLLYCVFIVSGVDNIVRPKLIGDRSKMHPALVFLSVLGGVYFLGAVGVFIGPVIMALFVVFLKIYEKEISRK